MTQGTQRNGILPVRTSPGAIEFAGGLSRRKEAS